MNKKQKYRVVKNLELDESNFEKTNKKTNLINTKKTNNKRSLFSKILISATFMTGITFNSADYKNFAGVNDFNYNYESKEAEKKPDFNYISEIVMNNVNKKTVPVLMLHKIGVPEDRYTISPNNFRKLLNIVHESKYHLIGLKEFWKGNFSKVPVGKKPLLLTFDDAGEGQLYFSGTNKPSVNSAVGIMENFKGEKKDFDSKAVFFISYSDDKHNFREPFIEEGLSEKKIKYLFENGYDIGWHTPFHSNNTNASKRNIDEQTMILDALIYKSLGEDGYNSITRSFAHPFGAKPKNGDVLEHLFSKYDLVFDAWGGNSSHPLSNRFNSSAIPRIETHMNNIESILNNRNSYEVTKDDSIFYDRMFNKNINIEPKNIDNSNWDYLLNQQNQLGEL